MKYDVDYFINKFTKIPAKEWCTHAFKNSMGQFCALGHCGHNHGKQTAEGKGLIKILNNPTLINDGIFDEYQQRSPRARILAALRDKKDGK